MRTSLKIFYPKTYDQKLMLEFQKELQQKVKGLSKGKKLQTT